MLASASFRPKSVGLFDRMLNIRQVTARGDVCLVQVEDLSRGNEGNLATRLYQRDIDNSIIYVKYNEKRANYYSGDCAQFVVNLYKACIENVLTCRQK